jgi:hypothetical protein
MCNYVAMSVYFYVPMLSLTIKIKNLAMLRKIHGTNFFHIKLLDHPNIKCQNGRVLPLAQDFYFNGQTLHIMHVIYKNLTLESLSLKKTASIRRVV